MSSCLHEWLGTFMIAVRTSCLAMGLQKTYPPKPRVWGVLIEEGFGPALDDMPVWGDSVATPGRPLSPRVVLYRQWSPWMTRWGAAALADQRCTPVPGLCLGRSRAVCDRGLLAALVQ